MIVRECHLDLEWKSDRDIKLGPVAYFTAPRSAPLMASYSFGGAIKRWLPHEPCPDDIREHALAGGRFVAHNAGNFERKAWELVLAPRYGWPPLAIEQWRCTLAQASALGLPRSLEKLGAALGLTIQKDKIGKALIKFFCVPRADGAFNEPAAFPEKFEQFRAYCDQDVATEMAADARMIRLSDDEQNAWVLDQVINDRGVRIDRMSALAALELIEKARSELDARMADLTDGAVQKHSEVAKLTRWLADQGLPLAGVAKDDLLEALELDDLPERVRDALLVRQEAAKASTSKLVKMLAFSEASGRVQNRYLYHGTGPGRWSCLDPNLFNLPRPRREYEDADIDGAVLFEAIRAGDPAVLRAQYGEVLGRPLDLIADSLRGFIWAAPGHEFIDVDYSGIQGAIGAWLANEEWKLGAMREIIAEPDKPDLYRRAAAAILNTTTEIVTKKHWARQAVGKTSELALLFAGGINALVSMAKNYGMKRRRLHDLFPGVWSATNLEIREQAEKRYTQVLRSRNKESSDVLSREAWLACSAIVRGWRETNARTKESWGLLETAIREAVRHPGVAQEALGRVSYLVKRGALWLKLPSGRCVCYHAPRLRDQVWAKMRLDDGSLGEAEVVDREEAEALERKGQARIEGSTSPKVTVLGVDSTSQKMVRYALYGGLCMENLCLAMERDILLQGMRNCEAAGYPIVYHVYDAATAEVPRGWGSVEEMERLMLDRSEWARSIPLTAHGWRGKRYRKA